MTITAKIIADSIGTKSPRLTTMQLRYPKFIHGEAKTHRVLKIGDRAYESLEDVGFMDDPAFSRNASSSRAIPVERLIQDVLEDPVIPVSWGKNRPGMQATEDMSPAEAAVARDAWLRARDGAVAHARRLLELGAHKQLVNRVIEPWCHINVVVTATEWNNFFALRCHKGAQPEMQELARAMRSCLKDHVPELLQLGSWHLPYVDPSRDVNLLPSAPKDYPIGPGDRHREGTWFRDCLKKLSVARCARTSYLTHELKVPKVEEDLALYDRLVGAAPLHASPTEHQATPDQNPRTEAAWYRPDLHGNLVGWIQYRKTLPGENAA